MKTYYYVQGDERLGPFNADELKNKEITQNTLIWTEGDSGWVPAIEVAELKPLFKHIPPPINQRPPITWLVESILVTLFCCLPFGIAGIVNASKVESRHYAGDIEGANRASADAKKWTMISFWIGIAVGVLYFIIIMAGAASGY